MSRNTTSVSVSQAGGTTATLIAAKTGYKIVVLGFCLSVAEAAVTVNSTLQDETANTVRMTLVGNATQPAIYNYSGERENPAFYTAMSEGLELVTGTAAVIKGFISFFYEPGA